MNAVEQRAHLRKVLKSMAVRNRDVLRNMLTRLPDRECFGLPEDDIDRMVQMQDDFSESLLKAFDAAPIEDAVSSSGPQRPGLRLVVNNTASGAKS